MYAKIFAQIYDGTLCTNGPWQALVTFQQLLVLADKEGCVDMTPSAICRRTTIPQDIINKGIEALLLPDSESRTPTEDGRRIVPLVDGRSWGWRIVNYAHYRALKNEEDRREYHRKYWHDRKKKKDTSTEELNTLNNLNTLNEKHHDSTQAVSSKQKHEAEAYAVEKTTTTTDCALAREPATEPPPGLDLAAWLVWVTYRQEIKKPIRRASIRAAQVLLAKFGADQYAVVQQSVANGYQGLFDLKNGSAGNGKNQQDTRSRAQRHSDKLREIARESVERERAEEALGGGDLREVTGSIFT